MPRFMKKGKPLVFKILFLVNILVVVPLLISYFAAYISPVKIWQFAFFGLAYPIFLAANLLFVLLWLVFWKRYIFISLIVILIGWNFLQSLYPLQFNLKRGHPGKPLKMVSYNVNLFSGNQQSESPSETRNDISSFLISQNADIICLQEFYLSGPDYSKIIQDYAQSIGMKYFYFGNYRKFWDKKKIDAIIIFSRFPILDTGFFKIPDRSLYGIFTDVVYEQDTMRIYNLHLESIRFGNDDYSFYSNLTNPSEKIPPIEEGTKKTFWKLKKAFIFRAKEVDTLQKHLNASPYPIIMTGDFNDTPASYTYHQLTRKLKDSFVSCSNEFFGSTYAGRFPAFRIDYILHSDFFYAEDYQKYKLDFSDHYPVTATFLLNP